MLRSIVTIVASVLAGFSAPASAQIASPNKVVGTWRMVSAQIDPDGANLAAYGPMPVGLLVFTKELKFIEVLTDPRVPTFASNVRGKGTDEENRAAMAANIGMFGRYTVDENGEFVGDSVEGATFPNWVGDVRTRKELQITVDGDRMTNTFRRPDGTEIRIIWERVL